MGENETEDIGNMKGYDNLLEYKNKDIAITIPIRVCKMQPQEIYPEIIMRDNKGLLVKRCQVNRETNEPLPPYSYRYRNEQGEMVEKFDIKYYKVENEQETEIQPFPVTLGKSRRLVSVAEIPRENLREYLFGEGYAILPKNREDTQALYSVAKDMTEKNICKVVEIVHREGFKRYWGIINSTVKEDLFNLTLLTTTNKIQEHDIPIPKTIMVETPKTKVIEKSLF